MVKVGLWLELEVAIGFLVGLGLAALSGQRTTSTVLLIALEIIVTPIATNHALPYLLDVQRLLVGVAMAQLRPAVLAGTRRRRTLDPRRGSWPRPPTDADLGDDRRDRRLDLRLECDRGLEYAQARRMSPRADYTQGDVASA